MANPTVLLLYGGEVLESHIYTQNILTILHAQHISTRSAKIDDATPLLDVTEPTFASIVVTDYGGYAALPSDKRLTILDYCHRFHVGIYFAYVGANTTLNDGQISTSSRQAIRSPHVERVSDVLQLTRPATEPDAALPGLGVDLAVVAGSGYSALLQGTSETGPVANMLIDDGTFDGVRRVFNGQDQLRYWIGDLLLLDAVQWLSPIKFVYERQRWIGVDIDDIFQVNYDPDPAKLKVKIQAPDVKALIESQGRLSAKLGDDFKYVLGFNAGFFGLRYGEPPLDDAAGDRALLEHRAAFRWFDHFPLHESSVDFDKEGLVTLMKRSRTFAAETGLLPYITKYHLTPAHVGIFPIHEPLYEAWREVWDTKFTATTETERGFEHLGIRVAPRQSCGPACWSSNYSFDQVSRKEVSAAAHGEAFAAILDHSVALFMSHQSDYARDRIGMVLFEELVDVWQRWTVIPIGTGSNDELIDRYFSRQLESAAEK